MVSASLCLYSILTANSFFPWTPEPQSASHVLSFEHQHKAASAARSWAGFASLLCTTKNSSMLSSRRNLAHLNHSITSPPSRVLGLQGHLVGKPEMTATLPPAAGVTGRSLRIADSTGRATCSQQRERSDNGPQSLCPQRLQGECL